VAAGGRLLRYDAFLARVKVEFRNELTTGQSCDRADGKMTAKEAAGEACQYLRTKQPVAYAEPNTVRGRVYNGSTCPPVISPGETKATFLPEPTRSRRRARPRASGPAVWPPAERVALTRADSWRAKIRPGLARSLWSAFENQATGIVTPKGPRRRKRLGRARRGRARPRGARVAQTIFEIDQKKDPHVGASTHRLHGERRWRRRYAEPSVDKGRGPHASRSAVGCGCGGTRAKLVILFYDGG
jgi:hypothetical protein